MIINNCEIDTTEPGWIPAALCTFYPQELEKIRAWALLYLNTWRGNQRVAAGLTVAVLQELVYIGKFLEAQRWLADQESTFGMANEAIAWGLPDVSFAGMVVTQRNNWMAASDLVEATYRSYKKAVEAASTVKEIAALLAELG